MGVALKHLSHVIEEAAPGAALVFCGDFNSTPNSGNFMSKSTGTLGTLTLTGFSCKFHISSRFAGEHHLQFCACPLFLHTLWISSVFFFPGVFQLLSDGGIPLQHADWSSSGPEESCTMELSSAFPPLLSACGQPAYTNYVGGFHGCLDYIFLQPESMKVLILVAELEALALLFLLQFYPLFISVISVKLDFIV